MKTSLNMDYKTLYGLIFAPILISMLFLVYTQFSPDNEVTNNQQKTMQEQKFEQISKERFSEALQEEDTILIDVRTPQEQVQYWTIQENQEHIIYGAPAFESQIANLDTSKKYLVYCWHGVRSAAVREYMKDQWFESVKDLEGGIDNWNKG